MRAPMAWLRCYCDPPIPDAEAGRALNDAGIELERIEHVGVGAAEGFVVGRVVSAEQHPNADRLRVCQVDDGSGDPRTIVCGAPNVAAGQAVAVALPGAVMPDGTKLGEAKLRGVKSSGMILAEDEIGVGEDHDGIMVLPGDPAPGTPLIEYLQVTDEVLDLAIAPNRPDCLAIYGVARELHALTAAPLAPDPTDEDADPSGEAVPLPPVDIDPDICLRFTLRVFEGVKIGPSPLWLKARLSAAGQRPISNVVDITNYVMLLTGQPLHAFDLDRVRGGRLKVHRADDGQRVRTLDGTERTLDSTMALISDADGPTSIAGVMGGEVSEVSGHTTRVAMEAATWVGSNIMRTQAKLALRTEASARNEKGLHPEQAMAAQRLAARLMVELCGARMVPGTVDEYPRPAQPRTVELRSARVEKLLGIAVPDGEIRAILERLGFGVADAAEGFSVTVPYWRDGDVQREADLIEEVARIHGLDELPITLPARRRAVGRLSPEQRLRRRLEDALRDRGLSEVVAYSFTAPETLERLRLGDAPALRIANPLSEDQSVMRPLLLPGLLDAARHNAAHGRPRLALFESAHVYRPSGPLDEAPEGSPGGAQPAHERHHIGGVLTEASPGSWRSRPTPADFYAAKGLVEALLETVGVDSRVEPGERPFLHPGRTATVLAGDERQLGWVGELHPSVARAWDLDGTVAGFELDADMIAELAPGPAAYRDVTSFPAVIQDIAVVVDEDVPAAEVESVVRAGGGELLDRVELFDVYRGEQLGAGRKSLALRLEFRSAERTLTDEDVAAARAKIEAELGKIGGGLRA
ncbi:MAG: phenylalanyl-tRNA synthetase beta chain [Thermoleophilaceae bacterium]|nr:phenylalanyl-tRNA synthetase beta chain [Thermoleophilaceae bacterium]